MCLSDGAVTRILVILWNELHIDSVQIGAPPIRYGRRRARAESGEERRGLVTGRHVENADVGCTNNVQRAVHHGCAESSALEVWGNEDPADDGLIGSVGPDAVGSDDPEAIEADLVPLWDSREKFDVARSLA
jgi:hypothetical protein